MFKSSFDCHITHKQSHIYIQDIVRSVTSFSFRMYILHTEQMAKLLHPHLVQVSAGDALKAFFVENCHPHSRKTIFFQSVILSSSTALSEPHSNLSLHWKMQLHHSGEWNHIKAEVWRYLFYFYILRMRTHFEFGIVTGDRWAGLVYWKVHAQPKGNKSIKNPYLYLYGVMTVKWKKDP